MIYEQENKYISNVKAILAKDTDSESKIEELISLGMPHYKDSSYNTIVITSTLINLDMPSFEDFMEDSDAEEACDGFIKLFEQSINDFESNNLYTQEYSVELAYSKIADDNYTYKMIKHSIDATTLEEAKNMKTQVRRSASKKYPEDEKYTLEDDRLISTILNTKNNSVVYEKYVAIQGE